MSSPMSLLYIFTLTVNHSMVSRLPMKTIITHFMSGAHDDLLFTVYMEHILYKPFILDL